MHASGYGGWHRLGHHLPLPQHRCLAFHADGQSMKDPARQGVHLMWCGLRDAEAADFSGREVQSRRALWHVPRPQRKCVNVRARARAASLASSPLSVPCAADLEDVLPVHACTSLLLSWTCSSRHTQVRPTRHATCRCPNHPWLSHGSTTVGGPPIHTHTIADTHTHTHNLSRQRRPQLRHC